MKGTTAMAVDIALGIALFFAGCLAFFFVLRMIFAIFESPALLAIIGLVVFMIAITPLVAKY